MEELNIINFINTALLVPIYWILGNIRQDIKEIRKTAQTALMGVSELTGKLDK